MLNPCLIEKISQPFDQFGWPFLYLGQLEFQLYPNGGLLSARGGWGCIFSCDK